MSDGEGVRGSVALGFFGVVGEVGGDADEVVGGGGLGGGDGALDGPPGGLGVHRIGSHHHPVQVDGLKQVPQGRDLWLDLSATRCWVSTAPVAWSGSCRTRRMVDSDGRACPASSPRASRSAPVRSVACSHIAIRLRQPASTPVTARDKTVNRLWRTPRLSRGSVMFLRTWTRGWRDKAFVVEDDISAGSQDEGID